jgi:methionine synthase I (cobalamin-dependent)
MKTPLTQACLESTLTCDGAMGTELIRRGLNLGECGMRWNADRPGDIRDVHLAYRRAGCRLITTNSFGGTRTMLQRHGFAEQTAAWNRLAASLAAEAAGADAWVLGDVGPFGDFLEPMGETSATELDQVFREQIQALAEGGADAILVETMSDPGEVTIAIRASKAVCGLPVIGTFAFQKSGGVFRTMMGTTVQEAVRSVYQAGGDIAGANCGTDLSLADYLDLAAEITAAADGRPTILQPNAGAPKPADGGVRYDATPAEMAQAARQLRAIGISIVGGCCGTSPTHLAAIAAA